MIDLAVASFGLALSSIATGGIVWGIRLEGRVNEHTTLFGERERSESLRWSDLLHRLDRIEDKLDSIKRQ